MTSPIPDPLVAAEPRLGTYAGAVTRVAAFALDVATAWLIFALGVAGVSLATQLLFDKRLNYSSEKPIWLVAICVWAFIYFAYQWTLGGRTIFDAFFGLRVVSKKGERIGMKVATLRAAALFLSVAFIIPVGIAMLIQRERRALHDLIAGTAVVYDWDARAARLRWLAHRETKRPEHHAGRPTNP